MPTPLVTNEATEAFLSFCEEDRRLGRFLQCVPIRSREAEEAQEQAVHVRTYGPPSGETLYEWAKLRDKWLYDEHHQLVLETWLCRAADNFITYVTDLLTLVFRAKPEAMKSDAQATFHEIFTFDSLDELRHYLVEKRVLSLSFKSFSDLSDQMEKQIGLPISEQPGEVALGAFVMELRNLITHNRGRVNRLFLEKLGLAEKLRPKTGADEKPILNKLISRELQVGQRIHLTGDEVIMAAEVFKEMATRLDARAAEKFALPRKQVEVRLVSSPHWKDFWPGPSWLEHSLANASPSQEPGPLPYPPRGRVFP
jgi:hypothetical protein